MGVTIDEHDKKEIEHLIEFKKQFIASQSLTKQERIIRFLKVMRGEAQNDTVGKECT